jgi:hypothetical protein
MVRWSRWEIGFHQVPKKRFKHPLSIQKKTVDSKNPEFNSTFRSYEAVMWHIRTQNAYVYIHTYTLILQGRGANYSPPSSAEVKNGAATYPVLNMFMVRCLIHEHKEKSNFLYNTLADYSGRVVQAHSSTGIVCSNPTRGMDVCVCSLCVCIVLSKESYRLCLGLRNWKKRPRPNKWAGEPSILI